METSPGEHELLSLWRPAHLLALRLSASRELAEDAVQDACLKALTALRRGDRPADLRVWFLRVVANAVRDRLRGDIRRRKREDAVAQTQERHAPSARPGVEIRELLAAAMRQLDVEEQTVLSLHYESGLTQAEAAAVLEIPEGTVRTRVARGLKRLREILVPTGLTAAPAAIAAALALGPLEPGPAGLAEAVEKLVFGGKVVEGTGAAKAPSMARGGMTMKVIAGVVLAGALAAGAALVSGGGNRGQASPPPKTGGAVTHEHVAGVNAYGRLDGPAKESIGFGGQGFVGGVDDGGNLWAFNMGRWMRASDGRIMSFEACEYGSFGFDLEEGPIIGKPRVYAATSYGWPCRGETMLGQPDSGGKDEGIYQAIGRQGRLVRVWKNKEKGGRWWFARVAGGGAAGAPKTKGQSADALAVKFGWLNQPQTGLDGKLRFLADSCFYLFEGGKVTCILGPDDYKAATDAMDARPNEGYVGGDGTIYLGYYYQSQGAFGGSKPAVWRVTPDGKVEPFLQNHGQNAGDGDVTNQAGWFCGPHFKTTYNLARFIPPDAMLTSAHDEDFIRRIWKGRSSVLCEDGEWREFTVLRRRGAVMICGVTIGSGGTVYHDIDRSIRNMRLYRYTGIDFAKPTSKQRDK